MTVASSLASLADRWEETAGALRAYGAAPQAECLARVARELREALEAAAGETLTLAEAAIESGVPAETLRKAVAQGRIPNAGRKGAPRIRRADLPRRPRAISAGGAYDVNADALRIVAGGRHAEKPNGPKKSAPPPRPAA